MQVLGFNQKNWHNNSNKKKLRTWLLNTICRIGPVEYLDTIELVSYLADTLSECVDQ